MRKEDRPEHQTVRDSCAGADSCRQPIEVSRGAAPKPPTRCPGDACAVRSCARAKRKRACTSRPTSGFCESSANIVKAPASIATAQPLGGLQERTRRKYRLQARRIEGHHRGAIYRQRLCLHRLLAIHYILGSAGPGEPAQDHKVNPRTLDAWPEAVSARGRLLARRGPSKTALPAASGLVVAWALASAGEIPASVAPLRGRRGDAQHCRPRPRLSPITLA